MWAVAFVVEPGSYTFLAVSVIGHTVLIAAAAITVATWTAATVKPDFLSVVLQGKNKIIPKFNTITDRPVTDRHGRRRRVPLRGKLECLISLKN